MLLLMFGALGGRLIVSHGHLQLQPHTHRLHWGWFSFRLHS